MRALYTSARLVRDVDIFITHLHYLNPTIWSDLLSC